MKSEQKNRLLGLLVVVLPWLVLWLSVGLAAGASAVLYLALGCLLFWVLAGLWDALRVRRELRRRRAEALAEYAKFEAFKKSVGGIP